MQKNGIELTRMDIEVVVKDTINKKSDENTTKKVEIPRHKNERLQERAQTVDVICTKNEPEENFKTNNGVKTSRRNQLP